MEPVPCPANGAGTGPGPGANPTTCGTDNNHYGNYTEPSWANGGSIAQLFGEDAAQVQGVGTQV